MLASRKQEWILEEQESQQVALSSEAGLRKDAKLRAKCFFMVAMIAAAAMFVTVRSEAIVRTGYDLVQTKAQILKYEKENEALRLDIARLKSPQRIQQIATSQLGMVVPKNVYYASNPPAAKQANTGKDKAIAEKISDVLQSSRAEASKGR